MYRLKPGVKQDPVRRWALPDRAFLGHGACHILAGVFLEAPPRAGFHAEWIVPAEGFRGTHIYVTDGKTTFDYRGLASRTGLIAYHERGWRAVSPGWTAQVVKVDFDLLDTAALNARKMRGPDEYLHDPIPRARAFIAARAARFRHLNTASKRSRPS